MRRTIAAVAVALATATACQTGPPNEDTATWDCRHHGNHVCGPAADHPAGYYEGGRLVQPWERLDFPLRTG